MIDEVTRDYATSDLFYFSFSSMRVFACEINVKQRALARDTARREYVSTRAQPLEYEGVTIRETG